MKPMTFALMRCCTTPIFLRQYETSTNAVLRALGVGLVDVKGFNCCGYPLKNLHFRAYVLMSARNLALAEQAGLNIVTICNCCYGTLKEADHLLKGHDFLRQEINQILQKEGLRYDNKVEVRHLLEVFYKDIGPDVLKKKVVNPFEGLPLAVHYGCHILRPKDILHFDNPLRPSLFDELVEVTGAKSIPWKTKLRCCGAPMWGVDDDLAMDLNEKKTTDAKESGAQFLCVACSYCQLQFDRVQRIAIARRGRQGLGLPSILYTQLLGLSLGIDEEVLGIQKNELDISPIRHYLKGTAS